MSDILTRTTERSGPSFSLKNRIRRMVWGLAYTFLYRPTPRTAHKWRASLLRLFGAKVGTGVRLGASMNIWAPWNVEIANDCWVGDQATLYSMALIKLGERSVVSQGSHLCCGTHDYNDPTFQLYAKPITVGDDAWVCAEAFICPGVTIGAGAVVGARAVATKDIPEWTVWAGNPCVQRGKRKFREKSVG